MPKEQKTSVFFLFERTDEDLKNDPEYAELMGIIESVNLENRQTAERLQKWGVKFNITEL